MSKEQSDQQGQPPAIIVAGPTASGKSALAARIAEIFDGVVINADSMQVYAELDVITARPSKNELALAPHRLYGTLPAETHCSAARWSQLAQLEMQTATSAGKLPILCGGTGMYLAALVDGLSPIPSVPAEVRAAATVRLEELGREAFKAELAELDPEAAARIHLSDTQRLLRAWEVFEVSGRALSDWQKAPGERAAPYRFFWIAFMPQRDILTERVNLRFDHMMDLGALDEVRNLIGMKLKADLPVLKALGVPELSAFLEGELTRDEAIERAKVSTRRYAKRQLTWLRTQVVAKRKPLMAVSEQYSESLEEKIFMNLRQFLLTKVASDR